MNLYHLIFPYFLWILWNQTDIFKTPRGKTLKFFQKLRARGWPVYFLIYPIFHCAACFTFWSNLYASIFYQNFFEVCSVFCLIFSIESVKSLLKQKI